VLFFVSVGMLFDPAVLWTEPLRVLSVVLVILVGKTVAAVALVLMLRYSLGTALTVGASLAQIGEFSFILAGLGVTLGLMPAEAQSLVLAGAILSIAVNPALFSLIAPFERWLLARSALARRLEARIEPLSALPISTDEDLLRDQVIVVGHGRVGRPLVQALQERQVPLVVVDLGRERVDRLRAEGLAAVCGDAAEPEVLVQAHVAQAAMLVATAGDALALRRMVETARTLNPAIRVLLRAASEDEAELLRGEGLGTVLTCERELARGLGQGVIEALAASISARSA